MFGVIVVVENLISTLTIYRSASPFPLLYSIPAPLVSHIVWLLQQAAWLFSSIWFSLDRSYGSDSLDVPFANCVLHLPLSEIEESEIKWGRYVADSWMNAMLCLLHLGPYELSTCINLRSSLSSFLHCVLVLHQQKDDKCVAWTHKSVRRRVSKRVERENGKVWEMHEWQHHSWNGQFPKNKDKKQNREGIKYVD